MLLNKTNSYSAVGRHEHLVEKQPGDLLFDRPSEREADDSQMRKFCRIDEEREGEDGAIKWAERLPAQVSSDPLISLPLRESALDTDADAMLTSGYSQGAASVMVFVHLKDN